MIEELEKSEENSNRGRLNNAVHSLAYKILPHFVLRGLQILFNEGFFTFLYKIKEHGRSNSYYDKWIKLKEAGYQACENEDMLYKPLISVLVPVYNVPSKMLIACIESVVSQKYENWQLCIADDCSTMPEVKKILSSYENNEKISICYRTENGHISKATNSALELAKGEYVALLDCDDTLSPNALYEVAKVLNSNPKIDYIYSDEDKIDEEGNKRFMPHFKADWSPDTLMSYMYTCHLSVYRTEIVREIGGFRSGYEGSQDYDLALRFTEKIPFENIYHIPKILYHWRVRKESTAADASAKPYIMEAALNAKKDAIKRRNLKADIEIVKDVWQYRVNYIPDENNMVSVIIPSKDNPDVIERCIRSIREKTSFKNYEIVVVDNGSNADNKAKYESISKKYSCIYHYEPFEFNFSKMCNNGAKLSKGNFLLFLNDDTEVLDGYWLERMLGQAELSHVGAVGAKLLYPESNCIQHTGVINISNGPSHVLCGFSDSDIYSFARNILDFNYSAVTAACLLISKEKFEKVGCFNEDMPVAYNDIDLCFKLVEAGLYNVVRNDVALLHYESLSRGYDNLDDSKMKRLIRERDKLYSMHPKFAVGEHMDPFYNCNLAQNRVDFSCNYDNIGTGKSQYKLKKINDYVVSDVIKCKIDNISLRDGICAVGWGYNESSRLNNIRKAKFLVVYKNGEVLEFDTKKLYRADIGSSLKKKLYMVGFECISDIKPDKEFKVALAYGKKISYMEQI